MGDEWTEELPWRNHGGVWRRTTTITGDFLLAFSKSTKFWPHIRIKWRRNNVKPLQICFLHRRMRMVADVTVFRQKLRPSIKRCIVISKTAISWSWTDNQRYISQVWCATKPAFFKAKKQYACITQTGQCPFAEFWVPIWIFLCSNSYNGMSIFIISLYCNLYYLSILFQADFDGDGKCVQSDYLLNR